MLNDVCAIGVGDVHENAVTQGHSCRIHQRIEMPPQPRYEEGGDGQRNALYGQQFDSQRLTDSQPHCKRQLRCGEVAAQLKYAFFLPPGPNRDDWNRQSRNDGSDDSFHAGSVEVFGGQYSRNAKVPVFMIHRIEGEDWHWKNRKDFRCYFFGSAGVSFGASGFGASFGFCGISILTGGVVAEIGCLLGLGGTAPGMEIGGVVMAGLI